MIRAVDFAEFVEKEYNNDPVKMVDAFEPEVAEAAEQHKSGQRGGRPG